MVPFPSITITLPRFLSRKLRFKNKQPHNFISHEDDHDQVDNADDDEINPNPNPN